MRKLLVLIILVMLVGCETTKSKNIVVEGKLEIPWYENKLIADIKMTKNSVICENNQTNEIVTLFTFAPSYDATSKIFYLYFSEANDIPLDWIERMYYTISIPWDNNGKQEIILRHISKGRGVNPGTDNLNCSFDQEVGNAIIKEFSIDKITVATVNTRNNNFCVQPQRFTFDSMNGSWNKIY